MSQTSRHILNPGASYDDLVALYCAGSQGAATISIEQQQEIFSQADKEIKNEHFYFSIDIRSGSITRSNGITRWLGYPDTHFSFKNYQESIHEAHTVIQTYYGLALAELLLQDEVTFGFMSPVWVTILALKQKNGKYIYCKQECSPFQLTTTNKITEYFSRFTVIKEFDGEDYHSRIYDGRDQRLEEKLRTGLQKKFEESSGFSIQELRILKRYIQNENVTSSSIAKAFKIEKATVDTYNKRILKKTEDLFRKKMDNAKKVAAYFKRMELL